MTVVTDSPVANLKILPIEPQELPEAIAGVIGAGGRLQMTYA